MQAFIWGLKCLLSYIYIKLEKSCLTDKKKKEVMDILYKYKEAFSLRDVDRHLSHYRGRNQHNGQITILHETMPCKRGR